MDLRLPGSVTFYHADRRRKGKRFEAEGMMQVIQTWKSKSALYMVGLQVDLYDPSGCL